MYRGYRDPTGERACGHVDREMRQMIALAKRLNVSCPGWDADWQVRSRYGFTGIFAEIPERVREEGTEKDADKV